MPNLGIVLTFLNQPHYRMNLVLDKCCLENITVKTYKLFLELRLFDK